MSLNSIPRSWRNLFPDFSNFGHFFSRNISVLKANPALFTGNVLFPNQGSVKPMQGVLGKINEADTYVQPCFLGKKLCPDLLVKPDNVLTAKLWVENQFPLP